MKFCLLLPKVLVICEDTVETPKGRIYRKHVNSDAARTRTVSNENISSTFGGNNKNLF